MVKRFLASGRTGFYFAIIREGEVGAGDEIKVIARDPNGVPVSEITHCILRKGTRTRMLRQLTAPCELQFCLRVGSSTSDSGWRRSRSKPTNRWPARLNFQAEPSSIALCFMTASDFTVTMERAL